MNFEELNELSVAIRAKKVNYDFFTRKVEMTIVPEYGVKDGAKGKTFQLIFENCIYFSAQGISEYDDDGIEFIAWGKEENKNKIIELINTNRQIKGFGDFSSNVDSLGDYDVYFFENTFSDILHIVCWNVIVQEIPA